MTATLSVNGSSKARKPRGRKEDPDALFITRLSDGTYTFNSSRGNAVYKASLVNDEPRCDCKGAKNHGHCWHGAFVLAHEAATSTQQLPAAFTTAWEGNDAALQLPTAGGICASCGSPATALVDDGICPACSFFDDGTRAFRAQTPASMEASVAIQASELTEAGDNRPPALIAASILLAAVSPSTPPTRRCPRCGDAEALPGAILCATCQDRRTAPALTLPEPPSCDDVHWCVGGCGARALPGRLHCRTSTLGRGYCGLSGGAARDAYNEAVWA